MNISTTDQQYYENPEYWGEAQYVTLKDVIDNILLLADEDSYFKETMRFRASILGKMAIKQMNVDVRQKRKAISFALSPSKIFPYPRFMTNWYRISVLNSCGKLQPLKINNGTEILDYLQDRQYELLYDLQGEILEGKPFNAEVGDCCTMQIQCDDTPDCGCKDHSFDDCWVRENIEGGYFEFCDELVDQEIVIEFITAGLDTMNDCDLRIHHNLEMTIMRYIQYNLLMGKKNIQNNDIVFYQREYKREKRRSERLLGNKISIEQIISSVNLRYNN